MKKLKVALISHSFPPHMTGGVGSFTKILAEGLTKKGIEVTVFCGGKIGKELDSNYKIQRLPMLNLPPRAVWFQIQNYNKFAKELNKFDIIHGQNTSSTFMMFLKSKVKKPWIVTFHDCPTRGLNAFFEAPVYAKNLGDFAFNVLEFPLYNQLYALDLKKADKIIAVSYSLAEDLNRKFKLNIKKLEIIQNGVNLERIKKLTKHVKKENSSKIKLIFFGRLFYGKGITFLIESMKEVIKTERNIELEIYGEGPLKKVIENQILKYHLSEFVKLNKFLPNEKMIQEIAKRDIVVLPSLYEAFPIAYLEAMACSKPLIAFDYPFSREIIKNGKEGILVRPKDSKELARKILELAKNKAVRNKVGKQARKKVEQNFSEERMIERYLDTYRDSLK